MEYIVEGFKIAWSLLLSGDSDLYNIIFITIQVSSASILVSLIIGLPAGFALGYFNFPAKRFIKAVVDTLLALPTVVVGLLVYAFLTRNGPLGHFGLLFTKSGIVIGQVILILPIVISLTSTAVEGLDERLRNTLITLGAGKWQILLGTLYESRFALMTAAAIAYGRVISEVGVSMMIGGNIRWHTRTITTAIALETGKGDFGLSIALGVTLLLIGFFVNGILIILRKRL